MKINDTVVEKLLKCIEEYERRKDHLGAMKRSFKRNPESWCNENQQTEFESQIEEAYRDIKNMAEYL